MAKQYFENEVEQQEATAKMIKQLRNAANNATEPTERRLLLSMANYREYGRAYLPQYLVAIDELQATVDLATQSPIQD